MNKLISITWYIEPPIDFEYKQYVLYGYLKIVDECFYQKILSPHFLYLEKLSSELITFKNHMDSFKSDIQKNEYIYFDNKFTIKDLQDEYVDQVYEIVEFSIPLIDSRIKLGENILKKTKQILY